MTLLKVRERIPCEFFAMQMTIAGREATDAGAVRWQAGDWLLRKTETGEPILVVSPQEFDNQYEKLS